MHINKLRVDFKKNIIEVKVLAGVESGNCVYIQRISMITNEYSFELKRVKFPNTFHFAISINKAQG